MSPEELERLAEKVAAHLAPLLAEKLDPAALLDADALAALLKCSKRYAVEGYAKAAGFPAAVRLKGTGGALGHPRWQRRDVLAWIEAQKPATKRPGRPRKQIEW